MMFCYAQLDENGICVALSQLVGEVKNQNLIPLQNIDITLLGKKYASGQWIAVDNASQNTEALVDTTVQLWEKGEVLSIGARREYAGVVYQVQQDPGENQFPPPLSPSTWEKEG